MAGNVENQSDWRQSGSQDLPEITSWKPFMPWCPSLTQMSKQAQAHEFVTVGVYSNSCLLVA